jgi:hypothetical protein
MGIIDEVMGTNWVGFRAVAAGHPHQPLRLKFENEARFGRMSDPIRCRDPLGWNKKFAIRSGRILKIKRWRKNE